LEVAGYLVVSPTLDDAFSFGLEALLTGLELRLADPTFASGRCTERRARPGELLIANGPEESEGKGERYD
jgi:hypothetical protein